MLTLASTQTHRTCEGTSRRDFLKIGTLGIGGLSLASLLRAEAHGSLAKAVRDKSVIVLFLQGGPTQIETFDPKMGAPSEYRAMFGEVKTSLPGVTFGSHFPKLAARAGRMAVVRSFHHGISSHQKAAMHVAAGGNPTGGTMGSVYSYIAGSTHPRTGIPTNTVITPRAAGDAYRQLSSQTNRVASVGSLPKAYQAFDPSAGGQIIENMKLRIPEGRLEDRRALLQQLDQIRREADASGVLESADRFQQQAFDVVVGGVSDAFDLAKEDPQTIARYDTGAFKIPGKLQKKKSNVPGQSPIALGKQMLMARRLVEAGCRFVTVTSAGWDMHGNAFGINDGMPLLGPSVDKAASALLDDLEQRGLSDDVLLVITGEFGRTPRINKKAGRDHWGNLCTLALAGGGLRTGQVIGSSDRTASRPVDQPVSSQDLFATVCGTLFDLSELRLMPEVPSEISRFLAGGRPIQNLLA